MKPEAVRPRQVFLIGSRGFLYGGFETFVDKLTQYHQDNKNIKYHVAWKGKENKEFERHNARCFQIAVPKIGSAEAIYYDVMALKKSCDYIEKHHIEKPIIYILACRIGPFMAYFQQRIHRLGGKIYLNPDGHEWMRSKWNFLVQRYWKISERMMVKRSDLVICDSKNMQQYIKKTYAQYKPATTFIAYGADLSASTLADEDSRLVGWYEEKGVAPESFICIGRCVPENSYEIIIREFMKSGTKRNLVIISTPNRKLMEELEKKLSFSRDKRIKLVGTVYNQELLKKIRENAYAYIHGHTVGGTNPSLIEALGCTDLNLLVDVGFNREVAKDCALYWNTNEGSLARMLDKADSMDQSEITELGRKAKARVRAEYTWDKISEEYERLFAGESEKLSR